MRTTRFLYFAGVVALGIAGCLIATRTSLNAQQPAPVNVKPGDIGGMVSSSKGPEAGVWVIAETTDLPTRYIKEVVTDDRGRYLIPDLPKAKYTVWARGYGLVDSPKVQSRAGQAGRSEADRCAGCEDRRATLSGRTIGTPCSRFPRRTNFQAPGPPATGFRRTSRPRASGSTWSRPTVANRATSSATNIRARFRRMFGNFDSPAQAWMRRVQSGQAGNAMMGGLSQLGLPSEPRPSSAIGPPHRARRTARAGASAAAGRRAQRRDHAMGLGRSEGLSARRDLHRQAQPDRQRQRPDLRIAGGKPRLSAGARSRAQHHQPGEDSVPRSQHARPAEAVAALADLGRRGDLGQPHHGSQSDVR